MKKRLLSVFLCLCMVFGLVPATVWAETTTGHTHYLCGGSTCNGSGHENETYKTTFEKEIKQEGNTLKIGDKSWAPTKGSNDTFYILPTGTYYLGSDISPEYTIKIENNVTLCLNGHKITAADGMDAIYMTGGSFTLTDCKGVGTITHASSKTGRGVYVSSGTFNMYGGSITGNRATGDGGGVYKSGSNSSFNMYGGSITGNTANSYGGGVYVDGGGFTMSGGTIGGTKTGETNTATYGGGGVYAKANFEMTGGSITGNETNRGGGVYVTGKGSFTMSASADGQNIPSITGNNATENGGGVFLTNNFYDFFDKDFIGAKSFHELEDYPYNMEYPDVGDDLQELQDITRDFYKLYEAYTDFPELEGLKRGVGLKPSTVQTRLARAREKLKAQLREE